MPMVPPLVPVASPGQPIGVAGPLVSIDLKVPPYCFPEAATGEAAGATVEEAASLDGASVVAAAAGAVVALFCCVVAAGLAVVGAMVAGVEVVAELQLVMIAAHINRANITIEILFMEMPPL